MNIIYSFGKHTHTILILLFLVDPFQGYYEGSLQFFIEGMQTPATYSRVLIKHKWSVKSWKLIENKQLQKLSSQLMLFWLISVQKYKKDLTDVLA